MTQVSGLYIHVPFCRHLCNYCDFYKRRFDAPTDQLREFNQFLDLSIQRHDRLMEENGTIWAPLETIYLGGGTPSLWGKEGADYFRNGPLSKLKRAQDVEFTMEVDPGTWTEDMLLEWKDLGLNRISIGTQSLDPKFLKIMDRSHSLEESFALLEYCRNHDWNFSMDFLLGLPFSLENKRNIEKELELLLAWGPKHVSLYILNARKKYPHVHALPEDEFIRAEYLLVSKLLQDRGFHHYEVSNFALPGYVSRHNLKYWRSCSVAALGPTGTGLFVESSEKALRYKWKVTAPEVEIETLGRSELLLERTYLELRTSEGWRPEVISGELTEVFKLWSKLGYGHWDGDRVKLNSFGFLMLDSLMDDLFRLPAIL